MRRIIIIAALVLSCACAFAQDTNFSTRLACELQTAGPASLADLTWQQGTTPHIAVSPLRMGRPVAVDAATTVRMIIGQSGIVTNYALATNWLATNSTYYVQWPTIGTNSAGTNAAAQAWWYTVHFERDGRRYWTGDGRLYIEPTTSTAADGLAWQEITAGAATDLVARAQIALLSNEVAAIEAGEVVYGVATNTAYRGDMGQAASNLAAQAAGWGDHGAAGYALSSALLGYLPSAQAATQYLSITSAAAAYLPLSGYDGLVVLGTRTRGYAASTNLGIFGFAAGSGTSAGNYGFAAGDSTSAGNGGFAAGEGTSACEYGFAAGVGTSAGEYGFAAGLSAKGADGSFVFADSSGGTPFNRTNIPNSFSLRAAGGIYAEIGTNVFAVSNAVTMNGVELGAGGGSGWTNLAFSGTGNAITNATAAGATLTLERGTIEGGTGTVNETALGDPYVLTGTNVVFSYTNNWVQSWVATSAASQISFAVKTNAAQRIGAVLDITATTFPIQWLTSSPPVRVVGNIPSNAVSSWRIDSAAGSTNLVVTRTQ